MLYKEIIFLIIQVQCVVRGLSEGENCNVDDAHGTCLPIKDCPPALQDIHMKKNPKICEFMGKDPIVCCINNTNNTQDESRNPQQNCDPLPEEWRPKKTGQKSWDKCIEYQEVVFPCVNNGSSWIRDDLCMRDPENDRIVGGGWNAERNELPHMALLGYGNDSKTAAWLCGGSIISDWFVLTAAHCISSVQFGPVTFAAFGILKRSDPEEYWNIHKISKAIEHPLYMSPIKYHDIALLKTEKQIKISPTVLPICLDLGTPYIIEADVAGWGALGHGKKNADILQIAPLFEAKQEICASKFKKHRFFKEGINFTTQMCYGDTAISRDTCTGDSGGPLQVNNFKVYCMYIVIGITSFGPNCGSLDTPGVYTRIKHYVPWIESIVWP